MGSTVHPRANILTPTWKNLPLTPLPSISQEDAVSDDDTDDEVYVLRHEEAAKTERARLAGILLKNQKSAKSKKEVTPKRLRSALEAAYPGPLECFRITEIARKKQANWNEETDETTAEKRAHLHKFIAPLQAFSAIEAILQSEKAKLSRALAKSSLLNTDIGQNRTKNTYPSCYSNNADVMRPKKKKKTSAGASREGTPIAATSVESFLMEKAIARLECLEHAFEHTSNGIYAALEELLSQTNYAVPTEKSFVKLQSFFDEARSSHDAMPLGSSRQTLSELIKNQINANMYPLLAKSFKLNIDYQIEGRESPISGSKRRRRKRTGFSNAILNGLHKGKLHSHGFSLDLNLLKQDDTHQNLFDTTKTPSSGIRTPASQPSTPSTIRRVNTKNAIHIGDLHLSGSPHRLPDECCNFAEDFQTSKQNGPSALSTVQLNEMFWGNPLHNDSENVQDYTRGVTSNPEHHRENVKPKCSGDGDSQVHHELKNVSEKSVYPCTSEKVQDVEKQLGDRVECIDNVPVNTEELLERFRNFNPHCVITSAKQQLEDDSVEKERVNNHLSALCNGTLLPNSIHQPKAVLKNHQATADEGRYSNPHAQVKDDSSDGSGGQRQRHGELSLIAGTASGDMSHLPPILSDRVVGTEGEDEAQLQIQQKSLSCESSSLQGNGNSDVITIE